MTSKKPENLNDYKKWLKDNINIEISKRDESYYESVTTRIKSDFEKSNLWETMTRNFKEYNDEYLIETGYQLIRETKPEFLIKPFNSLVLKSFRKNVLENPNWPNEPQGGWILPSNWFRTINDILRTLIEVKYLDGVEFLLIKLQSQCEKIQILCTTSLEAREEGYYAAHFYIKQIFEIPKVNWDTEKIDVSIEIQITTQLQEVIRKLLHKYYENARQKPKSDTKWDYATFFL